MDIRQFAKINGVTFVKSPPGWDGRLGYKTATHPNCTIHGFQTKTQAAEAWLEEIGLSEHGIAVLREALEARK